MSLAPVAYSANSVATFKTGFNALIGGKINLCCLQSPLVTLDEIRNDSSRALSAMAVRELFVGNPPRHNHPVLTDVLLGTENVVVLAPELAFGFQDWQALDSAVRQVGRPLVFVAGFGMTRGKDVIDWSLGGAAEGSPSIRELSWNQAQHAISEIHPVNGGWCWLHGLGFDTTCICFLKNNFDQSIEVPEFPNLQAGSTFLHVQFDDLDLFPLICSDLIQSPADNANGAQARIKRFLDANESTRPVLISGLLLQHEPHNVNWHIAIRRVVNDLAPNRNVLLALANHAIDSPLAEEDKDRWRALTGVYGKFSAYPKNQDSLQVCRSFQAVDVVGAVVRDTRPGIFAGPVKWPPYSPIVGRFFWQANTSAQIDLVGIAAPIVPPRTKEMIELYRFTRRHPADVDWCPCVAEGLEILRSHLEAGTAPDAKAILQSTLSGVLRDRDIDADVLHEYELVGAIQTGTHALATLVTLDQFVWQQSPEVDGQLAAGDTNILIWCDPQRDKRALRRALGDWVMRPGTHPRLIVLGQGKKTSLDEGPVRPDRRDDITAAPPSEIDVGAIGELEAKSSDISQPHGLREAICVKLDRVATFYTEYDETQLAARRAALLSAFGLQPIALGGGEQQ